MNQSNQHLNKLQASLYIGIDVHLRNWKVCIRSSGMILKTFTCEPDPEKLYQFLMKHYPNYSYYSVYEAGFLLKTAY